LISEGTYARAVTGVLPTVTYPSHTTMVTGVAPAAHGILYNSPFDPFHRNQDGWMWYAEDVKAPTLWQAANRAGLVSSSVDWPVTVGAAITYNIAQYWRASTDDDHKLLRAVSTPGLLDEGERAVGRYPAGYIYTVESDTRRSEFAAWLIPAKRPRVHTSYFSVLDEVAHEHGPGTPEVFATVEAIAATLAGQGFAVIAIDAPLHGLTDKANPFYRNQLLTGSPAASLVTGERTFDLDFENNATGAQGPDGVIDPSGSYFINLSSLLTSRDNLRQASSDLFELTRAIPTLAYDANPTGDFDGSRIAFVGQSLGSIIGTAFVAMEPHVNVGVLNVPGGGIARLLDASPAFGPQIHAGLAAAGLQQGTPNYDAFFVAAQTVTDSGDSINFAFATAAKAILAQEVVGDATHPSDQVIPNSVPTAPLSGTEPLLAALGLTSITSSTQGAKLRVAVRFT